MDDKMDKDKKQAPLLPLAVTVVKKAAAPFQVQAVRLVSVWALLSAALFLGWVASAYALNHYHVCPVQPSSWMTEPKLMGAAAAEERAIRPVVAWCSAVEAAAAALALLLPERRRRSRRALASAALAATVANHLMFARVLTLFLTADPGRIFWWIVGTADVVLLAAGDIDCFLALFGKGC